MPRATQEFCAQFAPRHLSHARLSMRALREPRRFKAPSSELCGGDCSSCRPGGVQLTSDLTSRRTSMQLFKIMLNHLVIVASAAKFSQVARPVLQMFSYMDVTSGGADSAFSLECVSTDAWRDIVIAMAAIPCLIAVPLVLFYWRRSLRSRNSCINYGPTDCCASNRHESGTHTVLPAEASPGKYLEADMSVLCNELKVTLVRWAVGFHAGYLHSWNSCGPFLRHRTTSPPAVRTTESVCVFDKWISTPPLVVGTLEYSTKSNVHCRVNSSSPPRYKCRLGISPAITYLCVFLRFHPYERLSINQLEIMALCADVWILLLGLGLFQRIQPKANWFSPL